MNLVTEVLGDLAGPDPVRLDSEAVVAVRDRAMARPEAVLDILLTGRLAPEDLWPARGVAQLLGTIARVGATGSLARARAARAAPGWVAGGAGFAGIASFAWRRNAAVAGGSPRLG